MDAACKDKLVSQTSKLKEIISICSKYGYKVEAIVGRITEVDDLPDRLNSLIDVLWKSIKGIDTGSQNQIVIETITVIGSTLSLLGLEFPLADLHPEVVYLTVFFHKIVFRKLNLREILMPSKKSHSIEIHELAGLAERFAMMDISIDAIEIEEPVVTSSLQGLVSSVDQHIAVDQIGNLKSRINSLMSGGHKDWLTCLEFLTLLVKILTLRHSLLFRMMAHLKINRISRATITTLQRYIEKERTDNKIFLNFFAVPTMEKAGILAVFDPSEQKELVAYIEQIGISCYDMSKKLDRKILLIRPVNDSSVILGRPCAAFGCLRGMWSTTDTKNVRIRFKFTTVENTFNIFFIQSPDIDEYVYMKENRYCKYCKYAKITDVPDNAKWRIIPVFTDDKKEIESNCFILCTKQWPDRFLHIDKAFFRYGMGLPDDVTPSVDCLFTLKPPEGSPIISQKSEDPKKPSKDLRKNDNISDIDRITYNGYQLKQPENLLISLRQNGSGKTHKTGRLDNIPDLRAFTNCNKKLNSTQTVKEILCGQGRKPHCILGGDILIERNNTHIPIDEEKARIDLEELNTTKPYTFKHASRDDMYPRNLSRIGIGDCVRPDNLEPSRLSCEPFISQLSIPQSTFSYSPSSANSSLLLK